MSGRKDDEMIDEQMQRDDPLHCMGSELGRKYIARGSCGTLQSEGRAGVKRGSLKVDRRHLLSYLYSHVPLSPLRMRYPSSGNTTMCIL